MRGRALIPAILIMVLAGGCTGDEQDTPTEVGPSRDNGVTKLAPEDILTKAVEAAKQAKSVRISGNISTGNDTFQIDLRTDGSNARGTIKSNAGNIDLLKANGQMYIGANQAYWKEAAPGRTAAEYKELSDKWVKAAPGTFDLFNELSSVDKLVRPPARAWQIAGVNDKLPPYNLPAITLHSDTEYMVAVMVKGPPYPIQVAFPAASGGVDLTEWGNPVTVKPPAPDDIAEMPAAK